MTNVIKQIINILNFVLIQILTLSLLFTLLYFRFIRERVLGPINTQFTWTLFIFYVILILYYIFVLYKILKNNPKKNRITSILEACLNYYKRALSETYFLLIFVLGKKYARMAERLTISLYNLPSKYHKLLFYFIKCGIPLIVASTFAFEVCIRRSIHYFPYSIFLLFLYISYDLVFYIATYHVQRFIFECENLYFHVTFDLNGEIEKIDLPDGNVSTLDPETYLFIHANFSHFVDEYILFKERYLSFFENYENMGKLIYLRSTQVLRISFWLISWLFLLFHIIK